MTFSAFNFYKNKVAINLLAKNPANAKEVYDVLDGNVVVGILSKDFNSIEEGVAAIKEFQAEIPTISVGLGAGDPKQWKIAAKMAAATDPGHVNQVFTSAFYALGLLDGTNCKRTIVNSLISPTSDPNKVKISTGPVSSTVTEDAIVDVNTAVAMLKDIGVHSIKYFNLKNDPTLKGLKAIAKAAVEVGIPVIEPTGGISVENIYEIVKICLDAGCEKVIPHVYSSAIDKETGLTDSEIVKKLYLEVKRAFE